MEYRAPQLPKPARFGHNNPAYAFMDVNELRGLQIVSTIAQRNAVPLDKRGQYAQIFVAALRYTYMSADLSDEAWTDENNWLEGTYTGIIKNATTVYISRDDGSNENGDGSAASPYATPEYAVSLYRNHILNNKLTFICKASESPYIINYTELREYVYSIYQTDNYLKITGEFVTHLTDITTSSIQDSDFEFNTDTNSADHSLRGMFAVEGPNVRIIGDSYLDGKIIAAINKENSALVTSIKRIGTIFKSSTYGAVTSGCYDLDIKTKDNNSFTLFDIIDFRVFYNGTGNIISGKYNKCKIVNEDYDAHERVVETGMKSFLIQNNVFIENLRLQVTSDMQTRATVFYGNKEVASETTIEVFRSSKVTMLAQTMFINCRYAITCYENSSICSEIALVSIPEGFYFKNCTSLFTVQSGSKINIGKDDDSIIELRGEQRFGSVGTGCEVIFSKNITGDVPIMIPMPFFNDKKASRIILPPLSNEEYNKTNPKNFQTVAEVEALGSDYQFVLCNATGKQYHYKESFPEPSDGYFILNTANGGNTRYVSYEYEVMSRVRIFTASTATEVIYAMSLNGNYIIDAMGVENIVIANTTINLGTGIKRLRGEGTFLIFAGEIIFNTTVANHSVFFDINTHVNSGTLFSRSNSNVNLNFKSLFGYAFLAVEGAINKLTYNTGVQLYVTNTRDIEYVYGGGSLFFEIGDNYLNNGEIQICKADITENTTFFNFFPDGWELVAIQQREMSGNSADTFRMKAHSTFPNFVENSRGDAANSISIISNNGQVTDAAYGGVNYMPLNHNTVFVSGYRNLVVSALAWNSASYNCRFYLRRI